MRETDLFAISLCHGKTEKVKSGRTNNVSVAERRCRNKLEMALPCAVGDDAKGAGALLEAFRGRRKAESAGIAAAKGTR